MSINEHVVLFHHNREDCINLCFLFLNHQSVLIPTYASHREGFCVVLTLLPGDSPGLDFGKPVWTNQLFVVAPALQSAVV